MNPLLAHKRSAGAVLLLFFAFSMNALLYGFHAIEDGHVRQMVSGLFAQTEVCHQVLHHHHDSAPSGQQGEHDGCQACCGSHLHAAFVLEPVQVNRSFLVVSSTFADPFKVIPEVFLDRFIPPQNLA